MADILTGTQFMQLLVDQQPVYDELILKDIRPVDSLIGEYETGEFPPFSGVEHRIDRFNHVWPNTTKAWAAKSYASCIGTPCDKTEHCIGWGSERVTYHLEEQYWRTPLICFDQKMHVTHAVEQFEYIINDILRPTSSAVTSMFIRKGEVANAHKHWYINTQGRITDFTFNWVTTGDEEFIFDCSVPPTCGKLVPQALQNRWNPLMRRGYAGKNPFSELAPFIQISTDIETCWDLEKLGGTQGVGDGNTPSTAGNWRFRDFEGASKYWKYGLSGQLGNFMVRTDWASLRFNFILDRGAGAAPNRYRYQLILPYSNETAAGAGGEVGLKSVDNADFDTALFGMTRVTHKRGMKILTADMTSLNSEMPFAVRDLAGKWQFVMDNLGADGAGDVIENKRRNKGMWIADFNLAIQPGNTEFMEIAFHAREPQCVTYIQPCLGQNGYPTQAYESCPGECD